MSAKGINRGIKMEQIKMRILEVEIDGTAGTPAATGFSKTDIASVVDNGTGDYTIILKRPFDIRNTNKAKAFVQMITPARVSAITAVLHDRITLAVTDLAGAPADADFSVLIMGQDFKISH